MKLSSASRELFLFMMLLLMVLIFALVFTQENRIQVGEYHDFGWHSSYYRCNLGLNIFVFILLLKESVKLMLFWIS
jgi:hypothetical protein